jgi:UrcA family protein
MSLKTLTIFALTAAFAAGAAHASDMTVNANPKGDRPVAFVKTKGIDLSTAEGVAKVRSMVRWAAKSICETNGRVSLQMQSLENQCTKTAIASAEPQIERAIAKFAGQDRLASISIKINGR